MKIVYLLIYFIVLSLKKRFGRAKGVSKFISAVCGALESSIMKFIADMHVHSKFSRATAKNLDLEHLYIHSQLKGITVVATGDFTHPVWFSEISEKLVPAEEGLFRLRDDIAESCDAEVPESCRGEVRFILETEISNIYKKNDKTRKNHNLIYVPDLDTAAKLNHRLDRIGNIHSDGRPILGLDARNLLEIMLETSDAAFMVPAHIWTPWFSLFGSKSGFDDLEECFEDLSHEIFAVETGLSSDAPMNWRVSQLDSRTLVSNSDAHSPGILGRNATLFDTDLSFAAIHSALRDKEPARCLGTLDMHPEEGKYHMDGHRKCDVRLTPVESIAADNRCPVCGKPLTLGVLHRVEELADRPEGETPGNAPSYNYIIPLPEIISEIVGTGVKTKSVARPYNEALKRLGPELKILLDLPVETIEKGGLPLLGEAVRRMRADDIRIFPGFDGEYGRVRVFDPEEPDRLRGKRELFVVPKATAKASPPTPDGPDKPPRKSSKDNPQTKSSRPKRSPLKQRSTTGDSPKATLKPANRPTDVLNPEQRRAVLHAGSPLMIVAGPGAGKTRTLTYRIAHLIHERGVRPENILAVTFTQKAAREMEERLRAMLLPPEGCSFPFIGTFHAFCLDLLREMGQGVTVISPEDQKGITADVTRRAKLVHGKLPFGVDGALERISRAKQRLLGPDADLSEIEPDHPALLAELYRAYQERLLDESAADFDDLIMDAVLLLETDAGVWETLVERYRHILIDEYQDVNFAQYRLVRRLTSPSTEICVIGDPNQSIYGFRGSEIRFFWNFERDFPSAETIRLNRSYRSAETILEASHQVIREDALYLDNHRVYSGIDGIETLVIMELPTEKAEAVAIGKTIESLVGGTGFHSVDFGNTLETGIDTDLAFSDVAVLYRSHAQGKLIAETLERAGIPCQIAGRAALYDNEHIGRLLSMIRLTEQLGTFHDLRRAARINGFEIGPGLMNRLVDWACEKRFSTKRAMEAARAFPIPEMSASDQRKLCILFDWVSAFAEETTGKSVVEKVEHILESIGLRIAIQTSAIEMDAVEKVIRLAALYKNDIAGFLRAVTLQNDPDTLDFAGEKVALMTLHAAKGLEFPVVFIAGCEDGFLPFRRSPDEVVDIGEERRLFYVGMTRAETRLYLTYAKRRVIYGKTEKRQLSPFARDIEERLISLERSAMRKPKDDIQMQLELFG